MNKIIRQLVIVLSLVLITGLANFALAQKAAKNKAGKKVVKTAPANAKFLGMGDGIEYCAVTGEKLENKNIKGEFFGRTVHFCCEGCLAKAKKNPSLYVKPTEAEQIEAVKGLVAKEHNHHSDHHAKETTKTTDKPESNFLGKGDGITTCPVTGEPISKDVSFEVNGKTYYACCAGCIEKVQKNPELYLKPNSK
jgi:YHS domain-containing protein